MEIISDSAEQTMLLGETIGSLLKGGQIVALCGPLGAGKTCLVKGIVKGAGAANRAEVTSPTFVLVNEYAAEDEAFYIYHIDAYRLKSVAEFESLGFDEMCRTDSVVLIEWADKVESAIKGLDVIKITLSHLDSASRRIVIENCPPYIAEALKSEIKEQKSK